MHQAHDYHQEAQRESDLSEHGRNLHPGGGLRARGAGSAAAFRFQPERSFCMSSTPSLTIAGQLNAAQLAIANSLADAEILPLVAAYGYTSARLHEGQALFDSAQAACVAQKSAAGVQLQATQELAQAQLAAQDAYQALSKVARAVLKEDRASLTALGVTGAMPRSVAGFLSASETLFNNAANLASLADYGYDAERLEAEKAKISAYGLANQAQEAAKGAAHQASQEQTAALTTLKEWRVQYIKIARVALRDKKQLLEKIGIPVRTSPRAVPAAKKNGAA